MSSRIDVKTYKRIWARLYKSKNPDIVQWRKEYDEIKGKLGDLKKRKEEMIRKFAASLSK